MFDNYYFEALILKRHSLRKVELLQLIDELMQRKSDIYNQLKIKEKQLERLEKQLKIAVEAIKAVLHDEFILEHADAGLVMYLTQAEYKIKELEK